MALLFMDGVDTYTDRWSDINDRWAVVSRWDSSGYYRFWAEGGNGRFGGGNFVAYPGGFADNLIMLANGFTTVCGDSPTNRFFLSEAIKVETMHNFYLTAISADISALGANQGAADSQHLNIYITTTGEVQLRRGTTVAATSAAGVIKVNQWHRMEYGNIYIHDTAGTCEVRVDGVTVITYTGDTKGTQAARAGAWGHYSNSGGVVRRDDIAAWYEGGAAPNGFIGDFRIDSLWANGNGATNTATPVGQANAFQCVDDGLGMHNGDADYVVQNTLNAVDLFAVNDLGYTPFSVINVNVVIQGRSDAGGMRGIQAAVKGSGATQFSGIERNVPAQLAYATVIESFPLNPETGAAWAPSDINGLQVGYKLTK